MTDSSAFITALLVVTKTVIMAIQAHIHAIYEEADNATIAESSTFRRWFTLQGVTFKVPLTNSTYEREIITV